MCYYESVLWCSNQGWSSTVVAETLLLGSFLSIFLIKSFTVEWTFVQQSYLKLQGFDFILLITSLESIPSKGGVPLRSTYRTTPQDQISAFSSYSLSRTSGAI